MIVRGCEKRIYHVKNTDSELFDEAYFVLKVNPSRRISAGPRELEKEALRLVNGCSTERTEMRCVSGKEKLKSFVLGSVITCVAIGIISFTLWLAL